MANKTQQQLVSLIDEYIKANGSKEITGPIMNSVLRDIIDSLFFELAMQHKYVAIDDDMISNSMLAADTYIETTGGVIPIIMMDIGSTDSIVRLNGISNTNYIQLNSSTLGIALADGNMDLKKGRWILLKYNASTRLWDEIVRNDGTGTGGGADGKSVELQVNETHIQWRLIGDSEWIDLIAISELKGVDGKNIELQATSTYIQWRLVGDVDWVNLIALASLKGDAGREIELQKNSTHVQWRYVGDIDWTNLVALADLKGADGSVSAPTEIEITLTAAGWSALSQTVTVTGVIATNYIVIVAPTNRAQFLEMGRRQISCTAQATDELTFQASYLPTIDIILKIEIYEFA